MSEGAQGGRGGRFEASGGRSATSASSAASAPPACQRCGFPVASRLMGCKNPCANCGTVYPLGDCSD